MEKDKFLMNWNNIDIIEDKNLKKYAINKVEAYENKEQFFNECLENDFITTNRNISEAKIGGITCCCGMEGWKYTIVKKHGKTDKEAYYIELN